MSSMPPTPPTTPASSTGTQVPAAQKKAEGLSEGQKRLIVIGIVVVGVLAVAAAIVGAIFLVNHPDRASAWRDVFIIFMALESMVIGAALIVLMVQLAVLTNLLRHEIKPILEASQETVNTVRGTTVFISEHLVEPIMKLNGYVAGLERVLDSVALFTGLGRKK